MFQRHLDGLQHPGTLCTCQTEPVGHNVKQFALPGLVRTGFGNTGLACWGAGLRLCAWVDHHITLRLNFGETADRQPLRHFFWCCRDRQFHRKGDAQTCICSAQTSEQFRMNRLGGVMANRARADTVKQLAGPGKKELQVIIKLGHRAHGGAAGAHRIGLVNGNGRGHTFNFVDCRFVHAVQKLSGVGAEGFNIAALPLGKQGVKHQAGFARATRAGDHRQLPGTDIQIQIFQIVLACAADADDSLGHGERVRLVRQKWKTPSGYPDGV